MSRLSHDCQSLMEEFTKDIILYPHYGRGREHKSNLAKVVDFDIETREFDN